MEKKKQIPTIQSIVGVNDSFFEAAATTTMFASVERGEAAINETGDSIAPIRKEAEITITKENENEGVDMSAENFISFLQSKKSRKNTIPVRIIQNNYDRLAAIQSSCGENGQSIPVLVDWILDKFLTAVEKELKNQH